MQSSLSTFDLMVQEAMIFAGIYYFIRYYKTLVFLTASSLLYLLAICYLLSRFSRIRLCATPQTAAHQASPSLGFSRQEHWSGLPFPPPCMKVKSLSRVRLCATPWTAAHQAPPSMGFSRQEYWSGVPLPSANIHTSICKVDASGNVLYDSGSSSPSSATT